MSNSEYRIPKQIVKKYDSVRLSGNKNKPICLAPWKCLRFSPDGFVTVCCHNNSYILGKYPENTVTEIWDSLPINKLRKKISTADFSLGCSICLPGFQQQLFASVNPSLYENYSGRKDQPVILDFKIATECNLRCIMCSEYSSSSIRKEKSIPENIDEIIYGKSFLHELSLIIPSLSEARFSGGEPFLNKLYYDIWETIIRINPKCKISIQTNGTILNQRIIDLLSRGNFHINVSIDAATDSLYSSIRRGGKLSVVKENLQYFSEYSQNNNVLLGITVCCMNENWQEFAELVHMANSFQAKIWFSDVYFPFVQALWVLSSEKLSQILEELKKVQLSENTHISKHNKVVFTDMLSRITLLYKQAKFRETQSNLLISTNEQYNFLNSLIKSYTKNNPSYELLSKRILNVFEKLPPQNMINLSGILKQFHREEYFIEQLNSMDDNVLYNNFLSICY